MLLVRSLESRRKNNENMKAYHRQNRLTVLTHYSMGNLKCSCCGESEYDFLTIDHTENNGNSHRKEIGNGTLYRWLIKNGLPKGYDVLCMNCNHGKGKNNGICPHNKNMCHSVT